MPAKPPTIKEQALLAAELGLRVVPLVSMGKRPWLKDWANAASSDFATVAQWFQDRSSSNYGIVTGFDGLFVVDLDGIEGITWWREQGFAPGAEVHTPNGGMHVYYRAPDGYEVQTNAGKIHPSVDVRGVGGQAAGPGSMLPTGTYKGSLKSIANAPEAPAELIDMIPEKQTYTQVEYSGEPVKEASAKERSAIAWITGRLADLPEVWHEGAGWHDAVFQSAAWLWRMIRSSAYAMTEDGGLTILLTHTPVYPDWGEEKILEQWESARKTTEGQYAEPPSEADEVPAKLPLIKAQEGVPEIDSRGRSFMDLVLTDTPDGTEGSRWARRRQIFLESFRAGLSMQQAFSLAAGSVAGGAIIRQRDGDLDLFREAKTALVEYQAEQAAGGPPEDLDVETIMRSAARTKITLLSDSEREELAGEQGKWWGEEYLDWVRKSVKLANMPYHRLDMWIMLSVIFGGFAYVVREGKRLGMNLWGIVLGESSTGKTEALDKQEIVLDAIFGDDSPDIGADATTEALHDALIARDGKPSYQVIDEAHGILSELNGGKRGFRGDLVTRWTEFYEGKVRATLRSTKKDISGKSATTSFSLLLQGTTDKMARTMKPELWETGFLPRALFVIGENIQPSEEDLDVRLVDDELEAVYSGRLQQWSSEFSNEKAKAAKDDKRNRRPLPLKMQFAPEALERLNRGMRVMRVQLRGLPNQVALKPYANRFPNQVLKMASLVALTRGTTKVNLPDVVIALGASEEFLSSAVEVARITTDSEFAQDVDTVEQLVASEEGGVDPAMIYRAMSRPVFETNKLIDQLVAERRVRKIQVVGTGATKIVLAGKE